MRSDVYQRITDQIISDRLRDERKKVEMPFAHLKTHHRFERMRLRGLSGARDEFHRNRAESQDARHPFLAAAAEHARRMRCVSARSVQHPSSLGRPRKWLRSSQWGPTENVTAGLAKVFWRALAISTGTFSTPSTRTAAHDPKAVLAPRAGKLLNAIQM